MSLRHFARQFFKPKNVAVLMYHRVAELQADPWQLAVSADNFEAQVKVLKQRYNVVELEELLEEKRGKLFSRKKVCITFDDGYLDNYLVARPILEKYQCPATFFISTYFSQKGQPYWSDELMELIFSPAKLPSPFLFSIHGEQVSVTLDHNGHLTEDQIEKQRTWIWSEKPSTERCKLYFLLWEKMRPLPQQEIEHLLCSLKKMIGAVDLDMGQYMPMTMANIMELSRSKYIRIGMHTHTHPALSMHGRAFQEKELVENKNLLEKICGQPIQTLSYPHGRYNNDTLSLVRELNIIAGFTTEPRLNNSKSLPDQLGRFQVTNLSSEQFAGWLEKIFGI